MVEREPVSEYGLTLRAQVSDERWARIVAEAQERAVIFDAVAAHRGDTGMTWKDAVAEVAPGTPRPTFVHWLRHHQARTGPTWERLLDGRVPPDTSYAEKVRLAAVLLRRLKPDISIEATVAVLIEEFGDEGQVSGTWLKRVWVEAGVNRPVGSHCAPPTSEKVEKYHGGAGLALLAAAEAETGAMQKLAVAVQHSGERSAFLQDFMGDAEAVDDAEGRDDCGQFTADYNARRRDGVAAGEADDRWRGDAHKAQRRQLDKTQTLNARPENLAARLFSMGAAMLLTERRGFDGLDGPAGEWLGVLGGTAYMPATLDKTLAEAALLDVDGEMWQVHARTWSEFSGRWRKADEAWLRSVLYVDGTADPYWTRKFAASGKVSRVGRVMPCLTRVAVHSGAGVPLLVETHAGGTSLKKRLLPMLKELDRAIGPDADVGRLTIVDSEMGTAGAIWAMHDQTEMLFVTVVKGAVLVGAEISNEGDWVPYRQRDQLRDVEVYLRGKDAPEEGIRIRGVQMHRGDGRNPHTTLFVTNSDPQDLAAPAVASWYLGRWPWQEQQFAIGRDGGGLNRSHGYGGEYVAHVALEGKTERAERSQGFAQARADRAVETREQLADGLKQAPAAPRRQALALADADIRSKTRKLEQRGQARKRLESQPDEIFVRDTRRDSVMTCLKLTVLSLIEFTLQEYFGGAKMQWRTFIEQFVALPVTVRTSKHRCVYEILANPRQPTRMAQLSAALDEMNGRGLRRGERLLVFKLVGKKSRGRVRRSGGS